MRTLLGLRTNELEKLAVKLGLESYRGRQLAHWIYRRGVSSFAAMTDLRKDLRERFSRQYEINSLRVKNIRRHPDGTSKYLFELQDGERIEAVWLPHREWETICVSTQAGCPIGCAFCASGRDYVRNLKAGEIVGQVLLARKKKSSNIVFMGTGEPLLNVRELLRSLKVLNCEMGIGARHLTVSTIGIVNGIVTLADLGMEINLVISLHAPDDELRRRLIGADLPPLKDLLKAASYFFNTTGRRISFEYVLLAGVNDLSEHSRSLVRLLKTCDFKFHVNLLPYNETRAAFKRSPPERLKMFKEHLKKHGMNVTVRKERGRDIQAACGQLRHSSQGPGGQ